MALAVLAGIILFWTVYLLGKDRISAAAIACPMAVMLSLLLARLVYWYFRRDSYAGLSEAMADFSKTGYALIGAFAGCLLAAVILRCVGFAKNLPGMLDCMSIGGCAAIFIGRLSCFFNGEDRGDILADVEPLPWGSYVFNATSGTMEYRFATFLLQSTVAGCILLVLLVLLWSGRKKNRDGDITLVFLLLYCASQIVLDSTRYDALRLQSNGFISAVQVLCAITLVVTFGIFSANLWKKRGWKGYYIAIWLAVALGLLGAGYMEYYVQRHGDRAIFAYLVMSGCMIAVVVLGLLLRHLIHCENVEQFGEIDT